MYIYIYIDQSDRCGNIVMFFTLNVESYTSLQNHFLSPGSAKSNPTLLGAQQL